MVASADVEDDRSENPVAIWMPPIPRPTPIMAVSSGRPAAISEPNVMTRTSAATTMPSASVDWPPSADWVDSPEYSTPRPADLAVSPAAKSAVRPASVTSVAATE